MTTEKSKGVHLRTTESRENRLKSLLTEIHSEKDDLKKEIERLRTYICNNARDNCEECPHYSYYDGPLCFVFGDYIDDKNKKECDELKE